MAKTTSAADVKLASNYDSLRSTLLGEAYAARLDRPLAFWALPSDRRLPTAFLGKTLGELLHQPFDQLAATAPLRYVTAKCRRRLGKRQHRINDCLEIARLQQLANPSQLFSIRFDDEKRLFGSVFGSGLAVRGNRDHPSTRLENAPGSLQGLTSDRIEYDIHIVDMFFKAHGMIVNNLLGP
jgi:hypothetical protein